MNRENNPPKLKQRPLNFGTIILEGKQTKAVLEGIANGRQILKMNSVEPKQSDREDSLKRVRYQQHLKSPDHSEQLRLMTERSSNISK